MSKLFDGREISDYLPARLPRSLKRERVTERVFRGLKSAFGGGEGVCAGVNISPHRSPLLATRPSRGLFAYGRGTGAPHGMVWFDGSFIFARGGELFTTTEGSVVNSLGPVSDTDKSFFVFEGRLYIYPDKLYMESGNSMPKPIELDTGVIDNAAFGGDTVTLPKGYVWSDWGFEAGDCLRVVNADDVNPTPEGYYRILSLRGGTATLATNLPPVTGKTIFRRLVPNLTRCCVSGDRVYGIAGKDIFVSGAGSATDFYSRSKADSGSPVILHSSTDGAYTALSPWQGYVVFFKEDRICKLLGSRSDSFTLRDTRSVGIPAHLADTLCEVGNALYYASFDGIYAYRGEEPEAVTGFGGVTVTGGHGGRDGGAYCVALTADSGGVVGLFLPETGEWYPEDDPAVGAILDAGGFRYMQDGDGNIWKSARDGRAHGCTFDERHMGRPAVASVTFAPDHFGEPDGYCLTGLFLRVTGGVGGTLKVSIRYDEEGETPLGEYAGGMADRLLRVPLPLCFCDGSALKLDMTGDWVIHAIVKEYERRGQ